MPIHSGVRTSKPYQLEARKIDSGQFVQHAVMQCYECDQETAIIWVAQENPISIAKRFERLGWHVEQNKAWCPNHRKGAKPMRTPEKLPPLSNVINPPKNVVSDQAPMSTYMMYVYQNGVVVIEPLMNVQEMLLGDKTYMVIPR